MPREAVREDARQVVEDRVACRLESDEAPRTRRRSGCRERSQAVVLPQDIAMALDPMSDAQPALARETDELPVTQQRAEHHLELHRVRGDPTDRDLGVFDHADEFDRRLRASRARSRSIPGGGARGGGASPRTRASKPRPRPRAATGSAPYAASSAPRRARRPGQRY